VSLITAKQLLAWTDARNAASFENIVWDNGTLSFGISTIYPEGLRSMLPLHTSSGTFTSISYNGNSISFSVEIIKGIEYVIFEARNGEYVVIYQPDTTPPVVVSTIPASDSQNISVDSSISIIFNEAMNASTINSATIYLRDSSSVNVPATVSYNDASFSAVLDPVAMLNHSTSYTVIVEDSVSDASGNTLANDYLFSFTTNNYTPPTFYSIWGAGDTPSLSSANDGQPIELGVKFRTSQSGFITGVKYYKGAGTTGTRVGKLWSSTGALLGSGTFVNETSSGWQEVIFATPIFINSNTTYVASYYSPGGYYAFTGSYFTSSRNNGPLTALSSGESGGNGVYRYGAGGGFPSQTYNAANYWADVVFSPQ
jgi:hypothetical protein